MRRRCPPNERLQSCTTRGPATCVVPLFALANAGIAVDGRFLAHAYASPITLGILLGYVVGKPVGRSAPLGCSPGEPGPGAAAGRLGRAAGAGAAAGIGFTVSLLIATLAFSGVELAEAKLGVLSSVLCRRRGLGGLPDHGAAAQAGAGPGAAGDRGLDHRPGRPGRRAPRSRARPGQVAGDDRRVRRLRMPVLRAGRAGGARAVGGVRGRALRVPGSAVGRRAPAGAAASEASEAAGKQGAFWPMHDLLIENQDALTPMDLKRYAAELGLDAERFAADLRSHAGAARSPKTSIRLI